MEIGVFGLPGASMVAIGLTLAVMGMLALFASIGAVFFANTKKAAYAKCTSGALAVFAALLLIPALILLPIGHGREKGGDCLSELPETTLAVDSAFITSDILHVDVTGKKYVEGEDMVSKCAMLPIITVRDFPNRPITPGEYVLVVQKHERAGVRWTTHTFVPIPKPAER